MAMFEEGLWREALSSVQTQFNIEQLFPEQRVYPSIYGEGRRFC